MCIISAAQFRALLFNFITLMWQYNAAFFAFAANQIVNTCGCCNALMKLGNGDTVQLTHLGSSQYSSIYKQKLKAGGQDLTLQSVKLSNS
jgi:hypothetical protein